MLALGLNSGSSFDGIDAVLVDIDIGADGLLKRPRFIDGKSVDWPKRIAEQVLAAFENKLSIFELCRLNYVAGALYAEAARSLMRETQTPPEALTVIGFDGQTLYQEPADQRRMAEFASDENLVGRWLEGPYPCGLQIAEPAIVAAACETTVVTQFRPVEHALGGSGAPLMQFLDFVAFRDIGPVLTLNIGGIANCQLADMDRRRMMAFDTGPGNVMLDHAARVLLGKPYDADGAAAAHGKVDETLLSRLLEHDFFHRRPPRSAWRLDFGSSFADKHIAENRSLTPEDLLATFSWCSLISTCHSDWGKCRMRFLRRPETSSVTSRRVLLRSRWPRSSSSRTIFPPQAAPPGSRSLASLWPRHGWRAAWGQWCNNERERSAARAWYRHDAGDDLAKCKSIVVELGYSRCYWFGGGKVRITKLVEAPETGKYDYRGTKGNKLDWEMVPMGEYLVYTGQLPGDAVRNLTGADNTVHHPGNRFSIVTLRMFAVGVVIDRTTMEPVACISSPEGTPDGNLPVTKIADGIWDIQIDTVITSGHECGFSPNGKWFTMTNNTRQNSMGVFDVSDPDPRKWKRITQVKDAGWTGSTPSPFHVAFSIDGSKMFVSELHQKPAKSSVLVIDTNTWKTIKRFDNVGVDCQTMAPSYDGKYVFQIFSGFQRLEGGTFVFTQDTLEPVGYMPNFGGHHDCVIIPRNNNELIHSRCTTV